MLFVNRLLNNNGEVVWRNSSYPWNFFPGTGRNDDEILYYDGTTITQLTDNDHNDGSPQINDSGEVVWSGGSWFDDGLGFENIGPCLISAAAYGFRMSMEIWTLAFLFVYVLIVFHKIRARFKK